MKIKPKNYRKAVQQLIDKFYRGEKASVSQSIMKSAHAADIAEIITNIADEKQLKIFEALDEKQKVNVFVELPEDIQTEVIEEADNNKLLSLLDELEPDDAVDLLSLLTPERQGELLNKLPIKLGHKLRTLLLHGKESAGGIMTPILLSVYTHDTTTDVINKIKKNKYEEMIINVYIVDESEKLIGVVSLQDIIIADQNTPVIDIMENDPISVNVNDDQEFVSQTVFKYNLLSIPVIEENSRLVGRITIDDILEVVHEEADEDVYHMAGVDSEEANVDSGFAVARMRLPWLSICLAGSMVSAFVLQTFDGVLAKSMILISFLPAICAMGGNSGLQTSTVTIRNLTYGSVFRSNRRKLVRRELLSGSIIGITCGVFVGILSLLWLGNPVYGLIIGSSMVCTIFFSTCTGFFIPIFFNKIKVDPAIASGPLITTLNDAMSAFIYLTMASLQLRFFHLI